MQSSRWMARLLLTTGRLRSNTPKGANPLILLFNQIEIKVRISRTMTLMMVVLKRMNMSKNEVSGLDLK